MWAPKVSGRPSPKNLLVLCIAINILLFLLQIRSLIRDVINHQDRIDMPATAAAVNIRTGFNVTAMPNLGYSDMNLQSDVGLGLNKSWRDEANRSSEAFKTLENFEKRCQEGTIQKPFSLPKNNTHFLCPCVPLGLRK